SAHAVAARDRPLGVHDRARHGPGPQRVRLHLRARLRAHHRRGDPGPGPGQPARDRRLPRRVGDPGPRGRRAPPGRAGGPAVTDTLIRIEGMSSGYAGIPVVRGLDLHVDAGEVVALLGPNGAGKTTTLLTCSGIVKVLDGAVTILGEPVHYGSPHRMA